MDFCFRCTYFLFYLVLLLRSLFYHVEPISNRWKYNEFNFCWIYNEKKKKKNIFLLFFFFADHQKTVKGVVFFFPLYFTLLLNVFVLIRLRSTTTTTAVDMTHSGIRQRLTWSSTIQMGGRHLLHKNGPWPWVTNANACVELSMMWQFESETKIAIE